MLLYFHNFKTPTCYPVPVQPTAHRLALHGVRITVQLSAGTVNTLQSAADLNYIKHPVRTLLEPFSSL